MKDILEINNNKHVFQISTEPIEGLCGYYFDEALQ